jgi:hypothetical protein
MDFLTLKVLETLGKGLLIYFWSLKVERDDQARMLRTFRDWGRGG